MSLPRLDYRLPITVPCIAVHPDTREARVVHLDILWTHVVAIQDEPFPDSFQAIVKQYGGICIIRTLFAVHHVAGPFRQYHAAWIGYKRYEIEKADKYKFNLAAN